MSSLPVVLSTLSFYQYLLSDFKLCLIKEDGDINILFAKNCISSETTLNYLQLMYSAKLFIPVSVTLNFHPGKKGYPRCPCKDKVLKVTVMTPYKNGLIKIMSSVSFSNFDHFSFLFNNLKFWAKRLMFCLMRVCCVPKHLVNHESSSLSITNMNISCKGIPRKGP